MYGKGDNFTQNNLWGKKMQKQGLLEIAYICQAVQLLEHTICTGGLKFSDIYGKEDNFTQNNLWGKKMPSQGSRFT